MKRSLRKLFGEANLLTAKTMLHFKKHKKLVEKRRAFYMQFLNPGGTYFDVGANFGNRIEPVINENIKIVAIEPQSQCIRYLKKKYGSRINIVPKGLGATTENKTMYISDSHPISSFSTSWIKATRESGRFSKYKWDKKQVKEMDTLDNLISVYGKPEFIKIDVEGYEYAVLQGLSSPVKTLSFEYTIPERKQAILDCIDRILEIGQHREVLFNYSVGESMEWALKEWIPAQKMKEVIEQEKFMTSGFGDIYARTAVND